MRAFPGALLPAAACVWLVLVCAAPIAVTFARAPVPTLVVYQAGSVICHQKAERSLRLGGTQMPVCARCAGLYAAGAAGAVAALMFGFGRRRNRLAGVTARIALAAAALPMLVSVGLEWVGIAEGSNLSRFASALPFGAAAGWVLQKTVAK